MARHKVHEEDQKVKTPKPKLHILGEPSSADSARSAGTTDEPRAAANAVFDIDVVSDVVCPWCWVGKRRLEKAIALLGPKANVKVTWRPYQLNPSMPKDGADRREYIAAKFGSVARFAAMEERLVEIGASEGIGFRFDRISRSPNTLDAHRMVWLSQRHGGQDAVVEALFNAYFVDGTDVGEAHNLAAIAAAAGMEKTFVERFLASDDGLRAVLDEERQFKAMGINGVPGFISNGRYLFSGAIEAQMMVDALRESVAP